MKQHELGTPAPDIARKLGIAAQTFYRWKKQYGGPEPDEVRGLEQLREENARLKKLAGVSYDTDTGETFLNIEAERRFGQNWSGELRVRAFSGARPGDSTYFLTKDDYVQLSISRYF